jgi:hypothetical protein
MTELSKRNLHPFLNPPLTHARAPDTAPVEELVPEIPLIAAQPPDSSVASEPADSEFKSPEMPKLADEIPSEAKPSEISEPVAPVSPEAHPEPDANPRKQRSPAPPSISTVEEEVFARDGEPKFRLIYKNQSRSFPAARRRKGEWRKWIGSYFGEEKFTFYDKESKRDVDMSPESHV